VERRERHAVDEEAGHRQVTPVPAERFPGMPRQRDDQAEERAGGHQPHGDEQQGRDGAKPDARGDERRAPEQDEGVGGDAREPVTRHRTVYA
jgi:hypothetical protein